MEVISRPKMAYHVLELNSCLGLRLSLTEMRLTKVNV